MKLEKLIRYSYQIPEGEKLRKACLEYGYYHNEFKKSSFDDAHEIVEKMEDMIFDELAKTGHLDKEKIDLLNKLVLLEAKELFKEGHEQISHISDSLRGVGPLNANLIQIHKELYIRIIKQHIENTPLLKLLAEAGEGVLLIIAIGLAMYIYTKNKKYINEMIMKLIRGVGNIGLILWKVLKTAYRWVLVPAFKLLGKVKDLALWKLDVMRYGRKVADNLYKMKAEKIVYDEMKKRLEGGFKAKDNLIRTAYEIDNRLGYYIKKNILK